MFLGLLAASVGGPFFALSATGPLIQAWYARVRPGRSPYRLYALSNVGSLLALVSYPFVFEPSLSLPSQMRAWSTAYGIFVVLCGAWAVRVARRAPPAAANTITGTCSANANLAAVTSAILALTNQPDGEKIVRDALGAQDFYGQPAVFDRGLRRFVGPRHPRGQQSSG